jgi:hypothetical protein
MFFIPYIILTINHTYQKCTQQDYKQYTCTKNFYMFRRRDAILRTSQVQKSTSTKISIRIVLQRLLYWLPSFNKGMP